MQIEAGCANGHRIKVSEKHWGRAVRCPACKSTVQLSQENAGVNMALSCANGHRIKVRAKHFGKQIKCPECSLDISVPDPTDNPSVTNADIPDPRKSQSSTSQPDRAKQTSSQLPEKVVGEVASTDQEPVDQYEDYEDGQYEEYEDDHAEADATEDTYGFSDNFEEYDEWDEYGSDDDDYESEEHGEDWEYRPTRKTGRTGKKTRKQAVASDSESDSGRRVVLLLVAGWLVIFAGMGLWIYFNRSESNTDLADTKGDPTDTKGASTDDTSLSGLAGARQRHNTVLASSGAAPQRYKNAQVLSGAKRVSFFSDGALLWGWYAVPDTARQHPAVLYCHGGFALGDSDFTDANAFLKAGYAVFCPAWRGENGNSGNFEYLYGEVNDAVNAMEFLAAREEIDPDNIFIAGHSMGATLALLAAEVSERPRGVMACGAIPDIQQILATVGPPFPEIVFDWKNPMEGTLRSPSRFVSDLNCPVKLYFGSDEAAQIAQAKVMVSRAGGFGRDVALETIPGTDHFTALAPAITQTVTFFNDIRNQARTTPAPPSNYPISSDESLQAIMEHSWNNAGVIKWGEGKSKQVSIEWDVEADPGPPQFDLSELGDLPASYADFPGNTNWAMGNRGFDGPFYLWNIETNERHEYTSGIPRLVPEGNLRYGDVTPDGRHFSLRWTQGSEIPMAVTIHNSTDASIVKVFHHARFVRFTGHNSLVVDFGNRLQIVQLDDQADLIPAIEPGTNYAWELSPGGKWLTTIGGATLTVYDAVSGIKRGESTYEDIASGPNLQFSHDGKEVLSHSKYGLTIWDFETGKVLVSHPFTGREEPVAFVRNGEYLYQAANLYQRSTGKLVIEIDHAPIQKTYQPRSVIRNEWFRIPRTSYRNPETNKPEWMGLIGRYPVEDFERIQQALKDNPDLDYLNSVKVEAKVNGLFRADVSYLEKLIERCVSTHLPIQIDDGPDAAVLTVEYDEKPDVAYPGSGQPIPPENPGKDRYPKPVYRKMTWKSALSGKETPIRQISPFSSPFAGEWIESQLKFTLRSPDDEVLWEFTTKAAGQPRLLEVRERIRPQLRAAGIAAAVARTMPELPIAIPRDPEYGPLPNVSRMVCNLIGNPAEPLPPIKDPKVPLPEPTTVLPMTKDWSLARKELNYQPVLAHFKVCPERNDGIVGMVFSEDGDSRISVLSNRGIFHSRILHGENQSAPIHSRINVESVSGMIRIPNSDDVVLSSARGLYIGSISDGLQSHRFLPYDERFQNLAVSPDGRKLYVLLRQSSALKVFEIKDLLKAENLSDVSPIQDLGGTPDQGTLRILLPPLSNPLRAFVADRFGVSGLDLSSGERKVLIADDRPQSSSGNRSNAVSASADGTRICYLQESSHERLEVYDVLKGEIIKKTEFV